MKTIVVVVSLAFVIVSSVLLSLVRKGAALKPAGVIKPQEIGADTGLIATQIDTRLFPEFNEARNVVWRLEDEALVHIPLNTLAHYRLPVKPTLIDLRKEPRATCVDNCWYLQTIGGAMPVESSVEIFVEYFDRDLNVPPECDDEKILKYHCMKPVSVREVRRKIKTPAPHFFMQRYQQSQFYLFVERTHAIPSS